jgi:twitching motility two-component system response regulator PilH
MANVLIVDDSPTDTEAMKAVLEGDGHRVAVAESAYDGLETARRDHPDVILMDVVFQGMSGFQGTRKLARDPETRDIPVIMISGKGQETDRIWGLRQGAAEYLVKPVQPQVLTNAVTDVLVRRSRA